MTCATCVRTNEPAARLAVDYFVYRTAKEIGALVAVWGARRAGVHRGHRGELAAHSARICEACAWLGVKLDSRANEARGPHLQRKARCRLRHATNEELMIARHTGRLLGLRECLKAGITGVLWPRRIGRSGRRERDSAWTGLSGRGSGRSESTCAISSNRTRPPTRATAPSLRPQRTYASHLEPAARALRRGAQERRARGLAGSQLHHGSCPGLHRSRREIIVGLQTEAPLKRAIMPNGACAWW